MPELNTKLKEDEKPSIVFGIIADIQYADVDNVLQYGRMRYYRDSVKVLRKALNDWKAYETKTSSKLSFILQLGDLIDGFRAAQSNSVERCFKTVLSEFELENYNFPNILHIWGNHELFALKRHELSKSNLNTSRLLKQNTNSNSNYYFYDINDKLRLICMDQYEISALGFDETDDVYIKATEIIKSNTILRESTSDLAHKLYLERFRIYNGAVSQTQVNWLEEQLRICKKLDKKVILCGHIPLMPEAADSCAVWNSNEILDLIWSFDNLVLAYLAGHYHSGGYYLDKNNIHHLTVNAILETPLESSNSYVTAFVYENRVEFKNQNQTPNRSFTVYF